MHPMLEKVHNYTPNVPKAPYGFLEFRWSVIFFLDFAFSILNKKDVQGKMLRKQHHNTYLGRRFKKLHEKTAAKIQAKNPRYKAPLTIPHIDAQDFTREFFQYWIKNVDTPIVVKGYLKDAEITHFAEKDNLIANLGDLPVKHLNKKDNKEAMNKVGQNIILEEASLKEFLTLPQYEESYLNNFYGILNDADFNAKCKGDEIDGLHTTDRMITQWFISRSQKTGSTLHCAGGYNMFLNIKGQKEWFFIDPSYTPVVQAALSKYAHYVVSELFEAYEGDFFKQIRSEYPELEYVPIYKSVLEESDMLVNPSHWWHRVRNLTDYTVGCATRYKMLEKSFVNLTYIACIMADAIKHPKQSILPRLWRIEKNEKDKSKFIDGIFSHKKKKVS